MTIETTVNKHRGVLLIAIGGFLVFLYIRHKRQQAAAAAAAQAAADAAAAAQADPSTMDQNTYNKQFSQPAPAYLGSPFSGYGANAPNYPPPTQLQPGTGTSPTPPITFPNPAASSGNSMVGAATGGGAPASQTTGVGPATHPTPEEWAQTQAWSDTLAGMGAAASQSTLTPTIDPSGHPSTTGSALLVPNYMNIGQMTGYVGPQIGTGLYMGAAGEPGTPTYAGIGALPPGY